MKLYDYFAAASYDTFYIFNCRRYSGRIPTPVWTSSCGLIIDYHFKAALTTKYNTIIRQTDLIPRYINFMLSHIQKMGDNFI